ncbi:hypothetical protein MLD38_002855 [Melastoma candidum]|uniref:Uncharacterized protein n=1 Tax=Melastoma candidum TaxID=119954 RepID=A0ACB9S0Y0_9MYRT|nr:hypothetical protein MLD38_002855 [Melastoma candidum]
MSLGSQPPVSTVDPCDFLHISLNPDGTITSFLPVTAASLDPTHPNAPLTKDVLLNPDHATWVRLFLSNQPLPSDGPTPRKLPLIVYFHAGGFVVMSAASVPNHDFCSLMATELHAIVASVEYRLAPEHRLPAAYDDAADAMRWLDMCNDDWIREHADLSNCYIMGLSVGTNMAFRVGHGESLKNVRIKGLILHHPFFGGLKRTMSELTMWNNKNLPMAVVDLLWELALPVGADFDHEYYNPKFFRCDEL